MSKYTVIRIKGKQHMVKEGDILFVDKLDNKNVAYDVLLFVEGDKVLVGKPVLKEVKVKFKLLDQVVKGDKVYVAKYKAKSRYRKKIGFRPQFTKLLIEKIS